MIKKKRCLAFLYQPHNHILYINKKNYVYLYIYVIRCIHLANNVFDYKTVDADLGRLYLKSLLIKNIEYHNNLFWQNDSSGRYAAKK